MDANATTECPILQVYVDVFYIYVFGIGPTALLGLVFNAITLLVLRQNRSSVNSIFLLKLLAVSDIVFLIVCLIYFPIRHLIALSTVGDLIYRQWDLDIGPWIFMATIPLYFAAQQNRNWLVVIITVERFLNLMFPLWARRAITKRRLYATFWANVLLSVLCNTYNYWVFPVKRWVSPCTGEEEWTVEWQSWGREADLYLYTSLTVLAPLLLLYALNITLVLGLRRMFRQRSQITGQDNNKDLQAQRQATTMVIGITVVFTVCETPASLDRLATVMGIELPAEDPFFNYGRKVGLLLVVVDSAANFLSYCVSNRPFRQGLAKLCSRGPVNESSSAK